MAFQADCADCENGSSLMYSLQGGGMAPFSLVGCRWGQGKEGKHQVEQSRTGLSTACTGLKYCALTFGSVCAFRKDTYWHYRIIMSFHLWCIVLLEP